MLVCGHFCASLSGIVTSFFQANKIGKDGDGKLRDLWVRRGTTPSTGTQLNMSILFRDCCPKPIFFKLAENKSRRTGTGPLALAGSCRYLHKCCLQVCKIRLSLSSSVARRKEEWCQPRLFSESHSPPPSRAFHEASQATNMAIFSPR